MRAERIILEYLRGNISLAEVSEIYQNLTGEKEAFDRWNNAAAAFSNINWQSNSSKKFQEIARKAVEAQVDTLSESYFEFYDITKLTGSRLMRILSDETWSMDSDIESFNPHETGDGVLRGELVYDRPSTRILRDNSVRRFPRTRAVRFEIDKEKGILRISSAGSKAQRLRGIMNHDVGLKVRVLGDLTRHPDRANEKVENFRSEFDGGIADSIDINRYVTANVYSTDTMKEKIAQVDYEARRGSILEEPEIRNRLSSGWIIRGFTMEASYKSKKYELGLAATDRVSYVKVDKIDNAQHAREILGILRECFTKHIA